jgi:hypothetical protein
VTTVDVHSYQSTASFAEPTSMPAFSQASWAEAEDEAGEAQRDDGSIGLVLSTCATRVSLWDGPWEDLGTTASASAGASSVADGSFLCPDCPVITLLRLLDSSLCCVHGIARGFPVSVGVLSTLSGGSALGLATGAAVGSSSAKDGISKTVKSSSIDCPTAASHRLIPDDSTSRHARIVRVALPTCSRLSFGLWICLL